VVILGALLVYSVALWLANGHPLDGNTKADVRLIGLVLAGWLAMRDLSPTLRGVAITLAGVTLAAAAKAVALYIDGYWVIGTFDRMQAASVDSGGHLRIILVGGDSLMIVAPACLLACAGSVKSRRERALLLAAGLASMAGLLLSGTRTSVLVAGALAALVGAYQLVRLHGAKLRGRTATALVALLLAVGVGAAATGTAQRFTTPDAPGVGLNFRKEEVKSFLRLPARDLIFGQGFGGSFLGKSSTGLAVQSGWSHAFPVWLVLKTGCAGLVGWLALLAFAARVTVRRLRTPRDGADRALVLCGAAAVLGTLIMSLTLGRAALPEGALSIVIGWALVASPGRLRVPT
jgi:O-antigen ligase